MVFIIVFLITLFFFSGFATSEQTLSDEAKKTGQAILSDFKDYYSLKNFGKVGIGLGVSGMIANTSADQNIRDWFQDSVRDEDTDHFSGAVKNLGSWRRVTPLYAMLAASGYLFDNVSVMRETGTFGARTLRAFLVGMPSVLFWQFSLGAARPSDEKDSKWHPGEDNNSASGHTFTGAAPFLTAAKMTENVYLKSFLYLGSTATGFSRINDDQHYFSQTVLGWWLAFLAVESVDKVNKSRVIVTPLPVHDGLGIMATWNF